MRRALARCLQLDGHQAVAVADGREALARTEQQRWNLVCVDADLAGASGINLARLMKRSDERSYVVLVTGFASSFDDPGFLCEGLDSVLPKPWKIDELELVISRARAWLRSHSTVVNVD